MFTQFGVKEESHENSNLSVHLNEHLLDVQMAIQSRKLRLTSLYKTKSLELAIQSSYDAFGFERLFDVLISQEKIQISQLQFRMRNMDPQSVYDMVICMSNNQLIDLVWIPDSEKDAEISLVEL